MRLAIPSDQRCIGVLPAFKGVFCLLLLLLASATIAANQPSDRLGWRFEYDDSDRVTCGWRIRSQAAIGVWNSPWQCCRHAYELSAAELGCTMPAHCAGVVPSSER